jgi:hypothetical protein
VIIQELPADITTPGQGVVKFVDDQNPHPDRS